MLAVFHSHALRGWVTASARSAIPVPVVFHLKKTNTCPLLALRRWHNVSHGAVLFQYGCWRAQTPYGRFFPCFGHLFASHPKLFTYNLDICQGGFFATLRSDKTSLAKSGTTDGDTSILTVKTKPEFHNRSSTEFRTIMKKALACWLWATSSEEHQMYSSWLSNSSFFQSKLGSCAVSQYCLLSCHTVCSAQCSARNPPPLHQGGGSGAINHLLVKQP